MSQYRTYIFFDSKPPTEVFHYAVFVSSFDVPQPMQPRLVVSFLPLTERSPLSGGTTEVVEMTWDKVWDWAEECLSKLHPGMQLLRGNAQ